jgi:hypothetical protein
MGWRLYLALAVLLLLAADVRPQHAKQDAVQHVVGFAHVLTHPSACSIPSAVAFTEPQAADLERNREAAAHFGERARLDVQEVILHYSCVAAIIDNLEAFRLRGVVSIEDVLALLDWAGLWWVQVVAASEGIRFAGSTREVCVAGIYMPKKTVVGVIAPLPGSHRCLT